jgi:hypothetical protein
MPNATLSAELAALARAERGNGNPIAPPRTASVLGLGHYLPDEIVPNDPIAARIGVDHEWIVRRTGIVARHRAAPDESLTDLATRAGRNALDDALVDPGDIDTTTPRPWRCGATAPARSCSEATAPASPGAPARSSGKFADRSYTT